MNRCLDDNDLLAFFGGRLSAERTAAVQAHVDRCNACRELVAEVARTSSASMPAPADTVRDLAPPVAPPPPPQEERIVIRDGKVTRKPATAFVPPRASGSAMQITPFDARQTPRIRPGTVLGGRYQLDRIIGEGGTGVVWEATHQVIKRKVALKILKSAEESAARRFFREARVTAALAHPHIVEVHDVFVVPETSAPAMVMELLIGAPLARWLRGPRASALTMRQTARVLLPVVSALGAAHTVGVVHRDLKPENIFLLGASPSPDDPSVKVLDFGLAKLTSKEGNVAATGELTGSGLVLGTPHYMAPEQVAIDAVIDPRTDVWALGVILYECLAGEKPIEGTSLAQIFRGIVNPKIVPLAKRVPKLPKPIAKLSARMLAKDRDERPPLEEIYELLSREA